MENIWNVVLGLVIPLVGTTLGAAMVFFMKKQMNAAFQRVLLGFAAGVMIAASIWSLLIPAIEIETKKGGIGWIPAAVGFLLGIGFLLLLDNIIPHLHLGAEKAEGVHASRFRKDAMMVLAVTLHNIPEGMTVGVVFAGVLSGSTVISTAGAFALALGIAIQNFPEGAVISMPLLSSGISRPKAFAYGFMSGVVEPIGALITIMLTSIVTPVLPYILSFAAGAMIYVVVEELIPDAQAGEHSNLGTIGVSAGFVVMMILDMTLG